MDLIQILLKQALLIAWVIGVPLALFLLQLAGGIE